MMFFDMHDILTNLFSKFVNTATSLLKYRIFLFLFYDIFIGNGKLEECRRLRINLCNSILVSSEFLRIYLSLLIISSLILPAKFHR